QNGIAVPGRADRLWVFWRRAAGRVSGGPTVFYKVYRPGIRVKAGAIYSLSGLSTNMGVPEEVNIQNGTVFFPSTYEGQTVRVTYDASPAPGAQPITEDHVITWEDETGEQPVPMDLSVNEGSLDAFASYETVDMGGTPVTKLEKIWLFWSSTRGSGGELMYATLAPRIGPEANVGGSVTYSLPAAGFSALSRDLQARLAAYERVNPFTVPPIARRGPFVLLPRNTQRASGPGR
ncbi:MAG TPA: hypothetical protein VFU47_07370, partial [Armatimonadota bacterium]|nr:hypothetical protein [Armatimonadota bacterium]